MTNAQPEWIRIIAWFGIAFFCGALPILFAAILTYAFRKRSQVGTQVRSAKRIPLSQLQSGSGLVRVEGKIAAGASWLEGAVENALVYLRLWVEKFEVATGEDEHSEWKTLVNKEKGIPFYLTDESHRIRVNPNGIDRELVGEAVTPNDEQIQLACELLGISPEILRGRLRFRLWELRAGQPVTVVGSVLQGAEELELGKGGSLPLIVSTYLGRALEQQIAGQTKKAGFWALVLGIPGILFLLCGVCNGLIGLVRMISR